jgi:hypothetical protein
MLRLTPIVLLKVSVFPDHQSPHQELGRRISRVAQDMGELMAFDFGVRRVNGATVYRHGVRIVSPLAIQLRCVHAGDEGA